MTAQGAQEALRRRLQSRDAAVIGAGGFERGFQPGAPPPLRAGQRQFRRLTQQQQQAVGAIDRGEGLRHGRRERGLLHPGAAGEQFLSDALAGRISEKTGADLLGEHSLPASRGVKVEFPCS